MPSLFRGWLPRLLFMPFTPLTAVVVARVEHGNKQGK
jgi:hypothetical protein